MVSMLTEPLSAVLHEFLTDRCLRERNKELALALVSAGNRGEVNQLTRHWTDPVGTDGRALREGLGLTVENVLADGDVVVLRAAARAGREAWSLVAELRFDAAGEVVRYHDVLVAGTPAS